MDAESLEQMQARHRKELKELQGRITSKKKNATKKTRKGVNDECAELERQLKEKQAGEVTSISGDNGASESDEDQDDTIETNGDNDTTLAAETKKLDIKSNSTPQGPSQQAPGKKKNRQKERLARRAAEQEAAAAKAEEEASHMTDHRKRENEYMKKIFESHGLVEKDIEPDGHCLFSAVADQLSQNGIPLTDDGSRDAAYKVIRKKAAGFMEEHKDDFAPFLEEDFDEYVAKMRDTAEWGGELELTALAREYGVQISVVQDGRMEKIGEGEKELWLAYYRHGYGLGEHYNSLRKK